jgi:hypothetical protein
MAPTGRTFVALLVAVCALAGAGASSAASPARPPVASAPSEYVEVVPTAGGGAPVRARPRGTAPRAASGPGSALAAAGNAVAAADRRAVVALGAAMLAATGLLAAAAFRRRQVPNG